MLVLLGLGIFPACVAPFQGEAPELLAPRQVQFESKVTRIPISLRKGVPVVQVHINKQGPFEFLVDTGMGMTQVSASLAQSLRLPEGRVTIEETFRSPETRSRKTVEMKEISLGNATFVDSLAISNPESFPFGVPGVLGMSMFMDVTFQFDFPNRELILSQIPLRGPADGRILLSNIGRTYRPTIPVRFQGSNNRVFAYDFLIDTGSNGAFSMPPELREPPLPFDHIGVVRSTTLYGPQREDLARLEAVAFLGQHAIPFPLATFFRKGPDWSNPNQGLIGMEVLSDFVLTIDLRNRLVAFEGPRRSFLAGPRLTAD